MYRIVRFALLLPIGIAVTLLWPYRLQRKRGEQVAATLYRKYNTGTG